MRMFTASLALLLSVVVAKTIESAELPALPEGNTGIAAQHPGDAGIDKDPKVVWTDNFENGTCNADHVFGGITCTKEKENVHGGLFALEMRILRPSNDKSTSLGFHNTLKEPQALLFLRYYAKFGKDTELFHGGTHDGGSIFARAPGVPIAKPGIKADGKNEYSVSIDTWRSEEEKTQSPGPLALYVYHPEQRHQWGEHFFASGRLLPYTDKPASDFFGKEFKAIPDFIPERDKWYCYELMVKANTPGQRDGRVAFWVDGKLSGDFPNLRLRDVETLKANIVSLALYTQNEKITKACEMWFDDVVVAKEYIGPMVAGKK